MPEKHKVASITDVLPGDMKIVSVGDKEIVLVLVDGKFYALSNACVHRGGPLGEGTLDGCTATCPWHGWQFDVTTGEALMNPAIHQPVCPVSLQGTDIYVEI